MCSISFGRSVVLVVSFLLAVTVSAPESAGADEVSDLRKELQELKSRMAVLEAKLEAKAASAPAPDAEKIADQVTEKVLDKVQPSIAAASKSTPGEFNPAMGLMLDAVASAKTRDKNDFDFRSAEVALSANIDPFAKGWAMFNGTSDGVEVEEAAIATTALPYNLAVKGGRFFADFGRLSTFHDHDLPFVNRPVVLDRFVGGESQADGLEVNYLVPIDHYVSLTAGAYNKIGADNDRTDNSQQRGWNQFTYLGRAASAFNLSDADLLDTGASFAFTPDVQSENGSPRSLAGVDLTLHHTPLDSASYSGFILGSELLLNHEDRPIGTSNATIIPAELRTANATGLYGYGELKLSRRYSPGFLFDWAQDLNREEGPTIGYSPYLSIWITEFQRLRFQYTYLDEPGSHDNQFYLQWTAALGNHAHGFRDR